MTTSNAEDERSEQLAATDTELSTGPADRPSSDAITRTLVVGILTAVIGAWIATHFADQLRVAELVEHGTKYRGTSLRIDLATRNAAVAYGLIGGILSLSLGVIARSLRGRFSVPRGLAAGLTGLVLGTLFGATSSYGLTPAYFSRMEKADINLSILIHLGIWVAVGAASGIAFGVGYGTRKVLMGSLIGGMIGAALATLLFDIGGAFFPLAHTERPLSVVAGTRLAGAAVLCLFIVIGIVVVAFQNTSRNAKRT
jgi:hypothetical protein